MPGPADGHAARALLGAADRHHRGLRLRRLDTRGIQFLSNGDIVAAYIGNDAVGYTERLTGATWPIITGLSGPNAVEVGDGDQIFVSETAGGQRVRTWDLDTLAVTDVAGGFQYPNGLALNEEQDILYVADANVGIYRVPKNLDGTWGPKELLFDPPLGTSYDGVEVAGDRTAAPGGATSST